MTREKVSERDILIKNAVASLQRFGYPNVNKWACLDKWHR